MKIKNLVYPLVVIAIFMFFLGVAVPRAVYLAGHPDVTPTAQTQPAPIVAPPPAAQSAVVTSVSEPVQFQIVVPDIATGVKIQKGSKKCRVVIESRVEDAAKMSAFFVRGGTYYLRAQGARGE